MTTASAVMEAGDGCAGGRQAVKIKQIPIIR